MDVRFCVACGSPWVAGANVCGTCGAAAPETEPDPAPAPFAPPPAPPAWGAPAPDAPPAPLAAPPAPFAPPPAPPAWGAPAPAPDAPPAWGAPAPDAPPAPPAWGASLAPTTAASSRRPRRRPSRVAIIAVVAGLVGVVAVAAVAWLVLFSGPSNPQLAQDLVKKMAARDATASTLLDTPNSLRDLAVRMGVADLPGSVSVTVANFKATTPTATPGTSKPLAGDERVTATYTLTWQGSKGKTGHVDQTLTAIARKGTDGNVHFVNLSVATPIVFDLDAYFGTAGTTAADATKVGDDLKAGTQWIPGVTVDVTPADKALTLPDVQTPVQGHLSTWSETVSPSKPGNQRTWNVHVTSSGASIAAVAAATIQTAAPVAAQVNVGALSVSEAEDEIQVTNQAFWAAVDAGDINAVNALVSAGPVLDVSGLAEMKGTGDSSASGLATEASTGPEGTVGNNTYVLGTDGTWGIDTSRSKLTRAVLTSTGSVYSMTGSSVDQSSGAVICTTDITIKLSKVVFYTNDPIPEAVFSFASTNDCDVSDEIISVTVGWTGNSAGTDLEPGISGTDPGTTADRIVELPPDLTSSMHPVWIKITKYGDPAGGILPDTMTFTTN